MVEPRTYQTRVKPDANGGALFDAYAQLFSKVEHKLFARLQASEDEIKDIKREYLKRYGLTGRQFNAIRVKLDGRIGAVVEGRDRHIVTLKRQIAKAKKVIARLSSPRKLHQKRRRLFKLEQRLAALQQDIKDGRVRLCFGTRKLFRAQFALRENGLANHATWKNAWHDARNSQFMVLGSKDETGGCQGCVADIASDGTLSLRVRIPDALRIGAEKYVYLSGLHFNYGHDVLVQALGRNLSADKNDWVAISYRFCRDAKGWRVFVSTTPRLVERRSLRGNGVLGVDINVDHLAVARVDRNGNLINSWRIPCDTYGKSSTQGRAVIGDAIKQLMAIAIAENVPIVLEKLDFAKKKAACEASGVRRNRMLSSFAYGGIQAVLRARAYDSGIEVLEVNPAWTSVIGEHKFAVRYGVSRHVAAALVIGRRSMGLSERVPSQLQGTSCGSARNRREHVWSTWARVSRELRAAHAAPERPGWQIVPPRSPPLPQGPPVDDLPF